MMAIAVLLFLLGCVTIIYPIRAIGLSRRGHGVLMIIGAIALSVAAAPKVDHASDSANSNPGYTSSSHCGTDPLGNFRCDSESNLGALGSSSSHLVCRNDPLTGKPDCSYESSTR